MHVGIRNVFRLEPRGAGKDSETLPQTTVEIKASAPNPAPDRTKFSEIARFCPYLLNVYQFDPTCPYLGQVTNRFPVYRRTIFQDSVKFHYDKKEKMQI